jgi:hypothetical protein
VPQSLISNGSERSPPTLWQPRPKHWTPVELAIQVCEQENRALKNLVVSLSEIILSSVIGKK